ncbi:MAG: cupin domain-containing protein [Candidatus Contendobacter sp.]|nr:cupin domain-containing protein [Candidatus Contendobacter sp.]
MSVNAGHLFAGIPTALPAERFDLLLCMGGCRLERIVSIGHATPPGQWYDQDEGEWVALLQGRAELRFADEDTARVLVPGDYVWIPAHRRHRVEWTSHDPPAVWLALHIEGHDNIR